MTVTVTHLENELKARLENWVDTQRAGKLSFKLSPKKYFGDEISVIV